MRSRFVTVENLAELSGYTADAVRAKIQRGVRLQDAVWINAADGRILIDVPGYERWASGASTNASEVRVSAIER